jgi:hypothetical protein
MLSWLLIRYKIKKKLIRFSERYHLWLEALKEQNEIVKPKKSRSEKQKEEQEQQESQKRIMEENSYDMDWGKFRKEASRVKYETFNRWEKAKKLGSRKTII